MVDNDAFIISVHALERFGERFTGLVTMWLNKADGDELLSLAARLETEELTKAETARYEDLLLKTTDQTGLFIYNETMDAIREGRVASVPPLELASNDISRWQAAHSRIAWAPLKTRGYVLIDDYDGTTVATVLTGRPATEARSRLYGERKRRKGK